MSTSVPSWFLILFVLPIYVECSGIFGFTAISEMISGITNIFTSEKSTNATFSAQEDAHLNITELTTKYGYRMEEHTVTTEDDYILKLHRIPARNNESKPVFLMHGLLDCSDSWVLQGPGYALGYILSDEGYDVWMGNARGNKYSNAHKTLDPKGTNYWKFSWDEIGLYDLPAMIDYVRNVTGASVYYIGHSQGTTSFLVMNSLKPEYNDKVNMMFSLAPVAWLGHTKDPIVKLFTGNTFLKLILYMLSKPTNTEDIISTVCHIPFSNCDDLFQLYTVNSVKYTNDTMLSIISGHLPSSASTSQLMHYSQLVQSGRFCRFDFGEQENIERYGQPSPPDYDVDKVTVPTVLFYSNMDWLSSITDVTLLYNKLPNVFHTYLVRQFDHIDYLFASVAKDIIYEEIIKQIRLFEDKSNI